MEKIKNLGKVHYLLLLVLFTASCKEHPQTAEEWKKLGNEATDNADYKKAIKYYQKAIEIDSAYFEAYYNLGSAFAQMKDFDKAIEYYTKAVTVNDTIARTFFTLGYIYYYEKQDIDRAIEMYKSGIYLEPDSPEEYHDLGLFYNKKGSFIYAQLYLRKAAQLGHSLAQQFFIDNEMSWEDNFVRPDYEQIKKNIENKQSGFYYSKLWNRYQQGDSTMTLDEKCHLYYGYVFHENYSPYLSVHDAEQANSILDKKNPTKEEWEELVSLLNFSLSVEPLNCSFLYYQSVGYDALGKTSEVVKNINKIRCIEDALMSTGDGLTKERAIHVISVSNEYDHLMLNNLSRQSQSLVDGYFDVLFLQPNEDGLEELWFDVSKSIDYIEKNQFK